MSEEKVGIDTLKLAVKFGSQFAMATEKALQDGKIGIEDVGFFLPVLMQNSSGIGQYKLIPTELKDLDASEIEELCQYAREELNLENDKLEEKIDKCLRAVVVLTELVQVFRKKA